jgi:hypothetical protein
MRMVFMIVILLGTVFSRGACADPVMQVQLPFYDGKAYRCTQNSDDTPTHQMASTKYDLDFNMKIGDIVVSAADGVMRHGRDSDGFGTYAKVDHGNGHWTMYGHLGGYIAHDGDVVVAGQPIAYSGNTGKVYPVPTRDNPSGGQHLHFGVHDGAGTGVSQSMEVHAFDQSSGNLDWFATGTATESEFVCDESSAVRNGHTYESRPIGQIFSDYQCRELTDGGVLCWSGNPTTCEDGQGHVWYRKDNEGANVSNLWQKCLQVSGNEVSIFSYLEGGYGIGGPGPGTWTDAADDPIPNLPDFIVRKLWLETPWGFETYQYGSPEIMKMKAQFENIGDGNLPSGSAPIEVHFYLSKGYKEDPHSGDGAWKRVGTDYIQPENLRTGDTHTETEGIELWRDIPSPGIWNIVACIDHPQDDHNDGGDHPEKHESNNCSTEAVFEVTADGQVVNVASVDFVTSSLQFLQTPRYAGDQARFGAYVTNQGTAGPPAGIRSSYTVECPGTGRILLADDGTEASELSPGASAWEETLSPVTLPNVSGACTATFCADYQGAVSETDERQQLHESFVHAGAKAGTETRHHEVRGRERLLYQQHRFPYRARHLGEKRRTGRSGYERDGDLPHRKSRGDRWRLVAHRFRHHRTERTASRWHRRGLHGRQRLADPELECLEEAVAHNPRMPQGGRQHAGRRSEYRGLCVLHAVFEEVRAACRRGGYLSGGFFYV